MFVSTLSKPFRVATYPRRYPVATRAYASDHSSLKSFVSLLPTDVIRTIGQLDDPEEVFEVTLDLGRHPTLRFLGSASDIVVEHKLTTKADLEIALRLTGPRDHQNRAGVDGTLHRISAIVNADNEVIGLTCRVGRATPGVAEPLRRMLQSHESCLILGPPGSGKTSVLRDIARMLSDDYKKRVVVVDKSGEIGGHGDTPHAAIGSARRLVVPYGSTQHQTMIEAVENHTPHVILVDEISTFQETKACQTIAERGVRLIATAHGTSFENIVKNPTLNPLVGGISSVTLGDAAAKARGSSKTVSERTGPATFTKLIEIHGPSRFEIRDTESTVDAFLTKRKFK